MESIDLSEFFLKSQFEISLEHLDNAIKGINMASGNERTVLLEKDKLLAKVIENSIKHEKIYQESYENYKQACVKALQKRLRAAKEGKEVSMHFNITKPLNYMKEYERIIAMLEWEKSDVVTLTQSEFNNYVLDQWHWRENFLRSNAAYSSAANSALLDTDE